MAKILLNTRASRITIVDKILLLPAEVKKDEQLGKIVNPSKTLISERGKPGQLSPYARVMGCRGTRKLIAAGILRWSDEKVTEPGEAAAKAPDPEPPLPPVEPRRLRQKPAEAPPVVASAPPKGKSKAARKAEAAAAVVEDAAAPAEPSETAAAVPADDAEKAQEDAEFEAELAAEAAAAAGAERTPETQREAPAGGARKAG